MTRQTVTANVVRVRTGQEWNRADFFAWLDDARRKAKPPIPHDGALASAAEISHSTVSNWRNGKQRPTTEKLAAIARVLGVPPRDLWVLAGVIDADQLGAASQAVSDVQIEDEEESIRIIQNDPDTPDYVKDELIREIRRHQREAAAERVTLAQRLLEMARRVRGAH